MGFPVSIAKILRAAFYRTLSVAAINRRNQ